MKEPNSLYNAEIILAEIDNQYEFPRIKFKLKIMAAKKEKTVCKYIMLNHPMAMAFAKGDFETLSLSPPENLFDINGWRRVLEQSLGKWVRIKTYVRDGFRYIYFLDEIKDEDDKSNQNSKIKS